MNSSVLKSELWRIGIIACGVFSFGLLSNQWLLSIAIGLLIYLIWIFYQLETLYNLIRYGKKSKQSTKLAKLNGGVGLIHHRFESNSKIHKVRQKKMGDFYNRFQKIIKNLPYATVLINQNNEIEWINQSSVNLLGLDQEKDIGQQIENLFRNPKLKKILRNQPHQEIEVDSPISFQVKLAVQLIVVSSDLKVLIARDISEYIHLQEVRKSFISNASHELRTPLTVIYGYLEMLKIDKNLPKTYSNIIKSSFEQSIRMKNIVEGLLTLSTLESTELLESDSNEKIEMNYLLNQILSEQEKMQGKSIVRKIDSSIGAIGSKVEIISLCSNLIHNALIHNPKGTKVQVTWEKSNRNGAQLAVQDWGIGIASGDLPRITERFFRVKDNNQKALGTGLGLAITNLIASRHGLKLKIKSEVNQGSTFQVIFPKKRIYHTSHNRRTAEHNK